MARAGTIIWTTPPQLLTVLVSKTMRGSLASDLNSSCSHNAIRETVVYAHGFPSMSSMFHSCLFVRSRTAPLLLLTRILCSLSLLLLPLPLVGPFILAPEPQGTPQTAHQGPFAFASPVRTLAAWLMYCERDTCLLVSLPALHPLPAYHRSSPPRSLMVTSNAERRKCPTVTRLRCTQMVFEK